METRRRSDPGLLFLLTLVACGGRDRAPPAEARASASPASSELSAFEVEHGIGPISEPLDLGPIDEALAETGEEVFEVKCSACHKMTENYVGPALADVTTRRSAAYIMNMILNPQEMVERHPVAKQLLAERMSFMPNQQLTQEDARAVLEYLRTQAKGAPKQ